MHIHMYFVVVVKVNKRGTSRRAGRRLGWFAKCPAKRIEDKYLLCRIFSSLYKGWLV